MAAERSRGIAALSGHPLHLYAQELGQLPRIGGDEGGLAAKLALGAT